MQTLGFVLLYVDDPARSATFYGDLLDARPVEQSPTFAMFAFPNGVLLGLWSKHTVEPRPGGEGGAGEIAFPASNVDAVHADWAARGLRIIQPPTTMDFGRTFVAVDPDGHRLRVVTPAPA